MTLRKLMLAVVATLGCATSIAQAAPFSINISGATNADGKAEFTIVGDTTLPTATLTYYEDEETDSGPDFSTTTFTDMVSNLQLGPLNIGTTPDGDTTYSRSFALSNAGFSFVKETTRLVDNLDPIDETLTGYSLSFQLTETVYTTGQPADVGIDSVSLVLNSVTQFTPIPYSGVSQGLLAPVPRPGTLPLFGAALAVVAGAAGVTRRLRRQTAGAAA